MIGSSQCYHVAYLLFEIERLEHLLSVNLLRSSLPAC